MKTIVHADVAQQVTKLDSERSRLALGLLSILGTAPSREELLKDKLRVKRLFDDDYAASAGDVTVFFKIFRPPGGTDEVAVLSIHTKDSENVLGRVDGDAGLTA